MKKIDFLKWALMLVMCIPFAGCGDSGNGVPDEPEKDVSAEVFYKITTLESLPELVDVTISYRDADGVMKTEKLSSLPWGKEVKNVEMPFEVRMELSYKKKEGVVYDKESYRVGYSMEIGIIPSDLINFRVSRSQSVSENSIGGDKIETYLDMLEGKPTVVSLQKNPD